MQNSGKSIYTHKIDQFLQSCREEVRIKCLVKFYNPAHEKPTLVDEIDQTINAFKSNSLFEKADLTTKKNEAKKAANKLISLKGFNQNKNKKGNATNETTKAVNLGAGGDTGRERGFQAFNKLLKSKKESVVAHASASSPRSEAPDFSQLNSNSLGNGSIKTSASGNNLGSFNQKLKAKSKSVTASDNNCNNASDFQRPLNQNQKIPPLLSLNSPPPKEYLAARNRSVDRSNVNTNVNQRNNRNPSANQRRRSRNRVGNAELTLHPSRGNSPDLQFGPSRPRSNSNASETSCTSGISSTSTTRNRPRQNRNQYPRPGHICPICFEGFQVKQELGKHLKSFCTVIRTNIFTEPDGFSLYQILERGVKCNLCKTTLNNDRMIEEHKRESHANDPKLNNILVNLIYCATCSEMLPLDIISQHRNSGFHKELSVMHNQPAQHKVVLLRKNAYCMLCRKSPHGRKINEHMSSHQHVNKSNGQNCQIWCYICQTPLPNIGNDIFGHLMSQFHKERAAQDFLCPFCPGYFKFHPFVDHIVNTNCIDKFIFN